MKINSVQVSETDCVYVINPHLQHRAGEDDVGTKGILRVVSLVLTEVCLGQGHGQGSLGVHLKHTVNISLLFSTSLMNGITHIGLCRLYIREKVQSLAYGLLALGICQEPLVDWTALTQFNI